MQLQKMSYWLFVGFPFHRYISSHKNDQFMIYGRFALITAASQDFRTNSSCQHFEIITMQVKKNLFLSKLLIPDEGARVILAFRLICLDSCGWMMSLDWNFRFYSLITVILQNFGGKNVLSNSFGTQTIRKTSVTRE